MSYAHSTEARFSMGRVVSATFRVIFRRAGLIVGLCALYVVFNAAVTELVAAAIRTNPALFPYRSLLILPVTYLCLAFVTAACTIGAVDDVAGRPAAATQAMRQGWRRTLPVFGVYLVSAIVIIIGLALLLVPGIIAGLRWFVAVPASSAEGTGFRASFSRSAALTKGHRWKLLGLSAGGLVLVSLIVALPLLIYMAATGEGFLAILLQYAASGWTIHLATGPTFIIATAIQIVGVAVTYAQLRQAKEGGLPTQVAEVFA